MSSNVNDRYLEARVMSASPVELVRMLYGAAQQAVREARRRLAAGDPGARSREISRAMEILVELSAALDRKKGGELAGELAELYDYMRRRLGDANVRQADEPLEEVLRLLATVSAAWDEVAAASRPEALPAAQPRPAATAPAGYGAAAFRGAPSYPLASQSWSA
jgi:flagellar secretion chaperone FliS